VSSAPPEGTLTRAEIRARLTAFAARWDQRPGNEQQEAQRFLLELLECYGVDTRADFTFEHHYADGTRADLFWPGFLLVEMKSASEVDRLPMHRAQAFRYWRQSADPVAGVRSPQWLLVWAFRRVEIWQPGEFPRGTASHGRPDRPAGAPRGAGLPTRTQAELRAQRLKVLGE